MRTRWFFFTLWIFVSPAFLVQAGEFSLTSPQLSPGGRVPEEQLLNGFGCTGGNVSPELQWQNSPNSAKSYAVTLYDPDAPTGSGWWHWVVFNIPKEATGLHLNIGSEVTAETTASIIQSRTDFGGYGYGGACPPAGDSPHRYIFSVYALDTERLELDKNTSAAMVGFFVRQHTIAKAELTVYYSR